MEKSLQDVAMISSDSVPNLQNVQSPVAIVSDSVETSNPTQPVTLHPTHQAQIMSDPSSQSTQPSTSQSTQPPNKRKLGQTYSKHWVNFKQVTRNGIRFAKCLHCNCEIRAISGNGTTCLKNHTERCKKQKNVDIREQMMIAATKSVDGKLSMAGNHIFDQERSRKDLAKAIILHEYPLSIVEHHGFRNFLHGLQPLFKVVCRNTIKSDIFKIYLEEKTKLYALFEQVPSRVAITTDMWSSKPKRGYMAITAHFIDRSWILRNVIIGFIYVPAPHTAPVILDALMECLLDWNLDRKVSTITVDNATTNDCMISAIANRFILGGPLMLDGNMLHMRCAAHVLNLIVQDGLDVIKSSIGKIRDSVSYWTATQGRSEKFEESARQLKIPSTKKLALDCKTRWNSTYEMLEVAIVYKDVFPRLQQREKNYMSLPTESEWRLANDICERLKLFFEVTESFSKTSSPTSNELFPKITEIKLALDDWSFSENVVIKNMAIRMIEKFDKYWSECSLLAGIGIVLDPRFKMKFLELALSRVCSVDAFSQVEKIRDACYKLLKEYQEKLDEKKSNEGASGSGTSVGNLDSGRSKRGASSDLMRSFDEICSEVGRVNIKTELDYYLEENVFPRSDDFDILNWWKANGIKYPTLQLIARDILAIPVSTVASESAFSTSGRVVSPHRSRLGHTTIEALMCAQDWLWNELEGDDGMSERALMGDEETD